MTEKLQQVAEAFDEALQRVTTQLDLKFIDSNTIITPKQGYYVADNTHYTKEGNAAFAEGIVQYVKVED